MGRFNQIKTTFTRGEISPTFHGRVDSKEYFEGCDTLENFLPIKEGGIVKRPGTQFVYDTDTYGFNTSELGFRLIPFKFSKTDSKIVFIGGTRLEVLDLDGSVLDRDTDRVSFAGLGINAHYWVDYESYNYAQSGDLLVLTYNNKIVRTYLTTGPDEVPPLLLFREDNVYKRCPLLYAYTNGTTAQDEAGITSLYPENKKPSPFAMVPYFPENINPDLEVYIDGTGAVGTTSSMFAQDSAGNNVTTFFRLGMGSRVAASDEGTRGTLFRVDDAGTTLLLEVIEDFPVYEVASASINTATDVITITSHAFAVSGQMARIATPLTTNRPAISGYDVQTDYIETDFISPPIGAALDNIKGFYGDFYVRRLGANTLTLHPTYDDAINNTNRINITSAGTNGSSGFTMYVIVLSSYTATVRNHTNNAGIVGAGNAVTSWSESCWSYYRGFPRTCAFYEGRLVMGGTRSQPDTIWMSYAGNPLVFNTEPMLQSTSSPAVDGLGYSLVTYSQGDEKLRPISRTISSNEANPIQWMRSDDQLLIGTLAGEYVASIDVESDIADIRVRKQTEFGSSNAQASSTGNEAVFINRSGDRVRSFKYNGENGSYLSADLNFLSNHMVFRTNTHGFLTTDAVFGNYFKDIAFQASKETIWVVTNNGSLISCSTSKEVGMTAWAYHPMRDTDTVKAICVVPNATGTYDDLYMLVQRSINGVTDALYLEKMSHDFVHPKLDTTVAQDYPYFSDSSIAVVLGSTTDIVTGLGHLEGEEVTVLVDNVVETNKTVASGQITLDSSYPSGTRIIIGLPYTAKLITLDTEAGNDFGSSQGTRKRLDRLAMYLYRSLGGQYGNTNQSTLFDIEYDSDTDLFTGVKRLDFEVTPDVSNKIKIEHSDPTPFNIMYIVQRGTAYD